MPAIAEIEKRSNRLWPHSSLRKPCLPVSPVELQSERVQGLIAYMRSSFPIVKSKYEDNFEINALTANFYGEYNQIIVIELDRHLQVIINPQCKLLSREKSWRRERCLSFPEWFWFPIRRSDAVVVDGIDPEGKAVTIFSKDKDEAALFMHEIGHLNRELITSVWKRFKFWWKNKDLYCPLQEIQELKGS